MEEESNEKLEKTEQEAIKTLERAEEMGSLKKRVNYWRIFAILIAVGFCIYIIQQNNIPETITPPPTNNAPLTQPIIGEINLDNAKVLGDLETAKIVIIEFSDFESPFCQRYYIQTFGKIKEQYIETGQVAYVFKHFPLQFHENAVPAGIASECANDQGKFWEFHDMLYEKGIAGGMDQYQEYAEFLELRMPIFNDCILLTESRSKVEADASQGRNAGIKRTPGFVINGKLLSGAQPFQVFEQVINEELAKSNRSLRTQ